MTHSKKNLSQETASVHAGKRLDSLGVVNSVEPASAYRYIDGESEPQFYPRYFNTPNQQYVIEQLCALENGEAGLIFGSGMAAIATTMMALLRNGDHVVLQNGIYGGTHSLVVKEFSELGIGFDFASGQVDDLLSKVRDNTRMIYVETPANPLLEIVDLRKLAAAAKERNLMTVVDNTFASPINQNPIDLGIDVVLHSGTKYLGGHSDLSFGAVVSGQEHIDKVTAKAKHYGGNLNAWTCYLIERSIKTLAIRAQRQNENAQKVAEFLEQHDMVDQVYYPGLPNHPGHAIASEQMHGFGGMLAFDLNDRLATKPFLQSLKLIAPAMSLGGVESTVTMPIHTSHKPMPEVERKKIGIGDRLVRMSVGIESADDLIEDLMQALKLTVSEQVPLTSTAGSRS